MFGSRSLQLDERWKASRRSFEAWILTSRKVFSEESEWKSESSYWLLKSEDNGSGKMAAHVGGGEWCSDRCPVGAKIYEEPKKLIRYRDNKIVSIKGERYSEVKKTEESGDPK
ncbi:UNVERIFIED_CONTAM: hypothetical protein NCL1_32543 [Trichonephila clavipes]